MGGRGLRRVAAAAGVVVVSLTLVACGNETDGGLPTGNASTAGSPSTTPEPTTPTPGTAEPTAATPTVATPTPERSLPKPVKTPTPVNRLGNAMLLTGADVAKADPKRGWIATRAASDPICGPASTRGNAVRGSLTRYFTTQLDASGGQWLTRYDDARAAKAAYDRIVATITTCTALKPSPTHARKMTENRKLALGDETAILRWYVYPLPADPGSEPGGFPYAVTRKGTVVSVLAFREMGTGIAVPKFEALTRRAAARLG